MTKTKTNEEIAAAAKVKFDAAEAVKRDNEKAKVIQLGQRKMKVRAAQKAAEADARDKKRLEVEESLIEKIEKDDLTDHDEVLLKRMKNRLASERKTRNAAERAGVDKTFKVHVKGGKPVVVKAVSKVEAVKKTDNAVRAFEVADGYALKTG